MNQSEKNRIKNLYEKGLTIPRDKPERQILLCSIGLIGAGKTTVIEPLSKKLNLIRFCTDDIRKLLKENGYGYESAQDINVQLVRKYLKAGYSVAIDGDSASEHSRKLIAETEDNYNIKAIWIHINPPEEFIINKLRNFKHTWLFRDGEHAIENYYERKPLHKNLDMSFVYTFDTSRSDISKQIDEAVNLIKNK